MDVEVRRANDADLDRAAVVLGEAFADYPWTTWTVDPDDHLRRITELQRIALRSYGLGFGQVWVGLVDGIVECAAVWMDSSVEVPASVREQTAPLTAGLEGANHPASVAAQQQIRRWRPERRHYYLATVGTSPLAQRRGVASAVLLPMLAKAQDEQVCAFLETSSDTNVAFYTGLGFEVHDHIQISGGGPDVWAMLKRPSRLDATVETPAAAVDPLAEARASPESDRSQSGPPRPGFA
jgi:ribosomal protein S18 acetylase RimI-like enzyme